MNDKYVDFIMNQIEKSLKDILLSNSDYERKKQKNLIQEYVDELINTLEERK